MSITVATLYISRMIRLGQLVHIAKMMQDVACYRQPGRREPALDRYCTSLLDTLHLLNCYLQGNPGHITSSKLINIDAYLLEMQMGMQSILEYWCKSTAVGINDWFADGINGKKRRLNIGQLAMIDGYVKGVMGKVNWPEPELWKMIGYQPKAREAWIATYKTATSGNPLVKNGRPSYWLTLVNNFAWQPTLHSLGITAMVMPGVGSEEGRKRLPELLKGLPGYTSTMAPEEPRHVRVAPSNVRIPDGVSVKVQNGLLYLTKSVLTSDILALVEPHELADWQAYCDAHKMPNFKAREISVCCGADGLLEGLNILQFEESQLALRYVKLRDAFRKEVAQAKRAKVVEKLKTVLGPEELKLIEGYLPK